MALRLSSPGFPDGDPIPSRYTCEGLDLSPPLAWWDAPEGTRSFALIVDDPDAPDPAAPKMTFVHWLLYNIPGDATGLEEAAGSGELPAGTLQGVNDWERTTYGGPCPPVGRHRYFWKLYALDIVLPDLEAPNKSALEAAMGGHILEHCELIGTYEKGG